jgi:PhoH-like ATPase
MYDSDGRFLKNCMKTYCLDTNVLIHDPRALFSFEENVIVVTEYVILELDQLKEGNEERNRNAREAGRLLREISKGLSEKIISMQSVPVAGTPLLKGKKARSNGKSFPELQIPGTNGKLILLMDDPDDRVQGETRDDQILGLLYKHRAAFKTPIIVVTKDTLMGIKAIGRGFGQQNYRRDQAKTQLRQLPHLNVQMFSNEAINALFSSDGQGIKLEGILSKTYADGEQKRPIIPGYYVMNYEQSQIETLLCIDHDERVRTILKMPVLCNGKSHRGIQARNTEQSAAVDALLDKRKTLVCMSGPAGTGKTLLAIAAALDEVQRINQIHYQGAEKQEGTSRHERKFHASDKTSNEAALQPRNGNDMQILIARPMVSLGREMGFLPGDVNEKMRPWIQPIVDNLKLILGSGRFESLLLDGTIEVQPLQFIRGRSINNAIVIIDEAQNTTPLEIKTIITRAGRNCKVVLTGDPDQIDVPYLDKLSNGLTYAADRLGREPFTAVIPLCKCERSEMAARAAELL